MASQREDTDPTSSSRVGNEPGLGASKPQSGAANTEPEAVDFDALHAALGDPLEFHDLPPEGEGSGAEGAEHGVDEEGYLSASDGRPSAHYASARPHTIPPTRAPVEDLNAPAVIVATEDTVPTAPPQMTVPMKAPVAPPVGTPVHARALAGAASSGPHLAAAPSSGAHAVAQAQSGAPSYPFTPPPFAAQRHVPQMTVRMPDRPVAVPNPRRPRTQTIVVRPRGPTTKQKLVAFAAMLLLVTAGGIAFVIWQKPAWLGIQVGTLMSPTTPLSAAPVPVPVPVPLPTLPATATAATAATGGALSAAPTATGAAGAPTTSAAGSVKKPPKPVLLAPPHPSATH